MKSHASPFLHLILVAGSLFALAVPQAHAQSDPRGPLDSGLLLDFSDPAVLSRSHAESGGVLGDIVDQNGAKALKVTVQSGTDKASYPGVTFDPPQGGWNLKGYTGVQVDITNPGSNSVTVNLRVDNAGDYHNNPWNAENFLVGPGSTITLVVTFGTSFKQPGFKLDPSNIVALHVFLQSPTDQDSFLVSNLRVVK